jgi:hypothetical protein
MASQSQRTEDLTLSEKMKIVQYLSILPAITIMVFMRRKVGFRMLKPSRLIGMAFFLWIIGDIFSMLPFTQPAGFIYDRFPLLLLVVGFYQRYRRWKELCNGERWHTLSPGISYFELLRLPPVLRAHRRIYRFLDPAACFIFSMFFGIFFSQPLARWFAFSSFCLFIYEQTLFEKQLDRDLDILDGLVVAEVQAETVKHFEGPQPSEEQRTLEETAGIPTGVAFDIHRQIELRRAKERAAAPVTLTKETQPVRQYVQVNMMAAPDNPPPIPQSLPPPIPPDNMAKDAPDGPA